MRRSITIKAVSLLVVIAAASLLSVRSAAASGGQIYVTPGASSVLNQANFTVGVRINPSTGVNTAQFTLTWDSSRVRFISLDTSTSAFGTQLQQGATANSVTVNRGVTLPFTGPAVPITSDSLIANVTLQALVGSGTGALALSNLEAYDANGASTAPTGVNGAVNFSTPVTPPSTGSGSSSGSSSGSTTTPAPKKATTTTTAPTTTATPTAADTTPPKVESVDTPPTKLQFNTASISLTTSEPTQVYVKYGLDGQLNLQTTLSDLATSHNISLDTAALIPGSTYSYEVVAKDASGNVTTSPLKTFKTKGYTLHVTALGTDNQPLKNAEVVLHSTPMTVKTDSHGVAVFNDVQPGNHHVNYSAGGKQYSQAISVDNAVITDKATGVQSAPIQNVAVQFAVKGSGSSAFLPITVFGIISLAILAFVLRNKLVARNSATMVFAQPTAAPSPVQTPSPMFAPTPSQAPTATSSVTPGSTPVEQAHGLVAPNPGSVIAPNPNDDEPKHDGQENS